MAFNILYVIQNDEFGGGERGFSQLIKGLNPKKFKIFVATTPEGRFYQEIREAGATVIDTPFGRLDIFKTTKLLKRIIKNENISIVHSQGARADFLARITGKWSNIPAMISTIQMPVEGFNVSWIKKLIYIVLDRTSERFVDKYIVPSQFLKDHLINKHGVDKNKISLIHNGVEISECSSETESSNIRKESGIGIDAPLIGAIGRMVWQKGFVFMIEAIPIILNTIPETMFLIVGDGPMREELHVKSKKLGVKDKIIFTGFRSDIKEILSAIDLLIVPSILEGFPMIILEAMAMAKPIVATNIDGITEQITDGEDGVLVLPRNPEAIAEAIIKVYNNREFTAKIGLAARKKVENEFSVEKMITETEKVYMSLLKENSVTRS